MVLINNFLFLSSVSMPHIFIHNTNKIIFSNTTTQIIMLYFWRLGECTHHLIIVILNIKNLRNRILCSQYVLFFLIICNLLFLLFNLFIFIFLILIELWCFFFVILDILSLYLFFFKIQCIAVFSNSFQSFYILHWYSIHLFNLVVFITTIFLYK